MYVGDVRDRPDRHLSPVVPVHPERFVEAQPAHAEIQAITAAAQTLGGKYLTDCTLYVTVEPCLMCAGALGWSQCPRIVYGAADPRRGYSAFTLRPFHPRATVTAGVLQEECAALMKTFFAARRK